ncbi:hypothetical protein PICSAR65_04160 [Mycobacterium avium subsp. paratuberculosis]|nr:hypothetical protein PICSAR65_04160 [Mycobacterium avium subsp. paratuberculosis]CAG7381980.1 hypothetical protein PICSAR78_02917 [Mycobacterium avium subsp. paratuberculosis]
MGGVPGRGGGVGQQHGGVDGQRRRQHRRLKAGRSLGGAQHRAQRPQREPLPGHPVHLGGGGHRDPGAERAENPRAQVHRRGQLDGAQHVQEPLGPAQVLHQRDQAEQHRGQGGQPGVAAQRVPAGQLGAGRQQPGAAGDAAQEQVRPHLVAPRRRLDHRAPVVRAELGLGHHRHLAGAVARPAPAAALVFAALAARRFRRPETVEFRGAHRLLQNASTAAPTMPAAASPARLNMVVRSAVHTRGSGGRP